MERLENKNETENDTGFEELSILADKFDKNLAIKNRMLAEEEILNAKNKAQSEKENLEIKSEPWKDFSTEQNEIDDLPDINGVPQTVWRGERLFLHNLNELGERDISTKGYERKNNRQGEIFASRDKNFASTYAIGTDGVKFYDGPLAKEEIPIGVVYKINNQDNHLDFVTTEDEPLPFGPFAGKFREFTTTNDIPKSDYMVSEIYIMDDFLQPNGHTRSDFRQPMEIFKIYDQEKLPEYIKAVKKRIDELDERRRQKTK